MEKQTMSPSLPKPLLPLLPRLLLGLLCVLPFGLSLPAAAQVSLPNGTVSEAVTDIKVQAMGGAVTIDRQYEVGPAKSPRMLMVQRIWKKYGTADPREIRIEMQKAEGNR
jgi:hypothetical protein